MIPSLLTCSVTIFSFLYFFVMLTGASLSTLHIFRSHPHGCTAFADPAVSTASSARWTTSTFLAVFRESTLSALPFVVASFVPESTSASYVPLHIPFSSVPESTSTSSITPFSRVPCILLSLLLESTSALFFFPEASYVSHPSSSSLSYS